MNAGATKRIVAGSVVVAGGPVGMVIVEDLEEVAICHFHHFFDQGFVLLPIPQHLTRLLCLQILISTLNI